MGLESTDSSKHTTSRDSLVNTTGPAIDRAAERDRADERRQHKDGREIEAKFFIPQDVVRKLIKGRPFSQIEQRYFRSSDITPLLRALVRGKRLCDGAVGAVASSEIQSPEHFSSARIRRTRHPGARPEYQIEFKGSKEGEPTARISRREISFSITSAEYKALKEVATAGAVRKRRYSIPGTIQVNNKAIPVTAQVDCLLAAGKKLSRVEAQFDTVDIELHDTSHIHALRAGKHSFEFLQRCIELSALDKELIKPLTTRRIAKAGLEDNALKALKKLGAIVQQINKRRDS